MLLSNSNCEADIREISLNTSEAKTSLVCILIKDRHLSSTADSSQEAQLSPSDRAMRLVSSYLANYHATVQKLLI